MHDVSYVNKLLCLKGCSLSTHLLMLDHAILLIHEDVVPPQDVGDLFLQLGDPVVSALHQTTLGLQQVPDRHPLLYIRINELYTECNLVSGKS